jgi:hypothetical protein
MPPTNKNSVWKCDYGKKIASLFCQFKIWNNNCLCKIGDDSNDDFCWLQKYAEVAEIVNNFDVFKRNVYNCNDIITRC